MRRLFLPLVVFAVTVAAIVLTIQANDDANPDDPTDITATDTLTTPVFSVRRAPEWLRRPTADARLEAAAGRLLTGPDVPEATCLRVHRGDEMLVENGQGLPLNPGDTQRLVTLAALDLLVPETAFTTTVVKSSEAQVVDGQLDGDLWLVGGGDPVLSTAAFRAGLAPDLATTSLEDLAEEVAASLRTAGVTRVQGRVLGDESRYPEAERGYESDGTWSASDNDLNAVGPLSALLVDNGFVGPFPDPPDPAATQRSSNPPASAASALQALLVDAGLEFGAAAGAGTAPVAAEQLGAVASPSLQAIAARALVDGTTAEMLFKETGRRSGAEPKRDEAAVGVFFTLLGAELPITIPSAPVDGSGLSALSRSTCDLLVAVLELDDDAMLAAILPDIVDTDLAACAPSTPGALAVYGSARGDNTALAGRYTAENGDVVTFAMIAERVPAEGVEAYAACNPLQQSTLDAVSGHPYGPDLDDMAPLPVTDG